MPCYSQITRTKMTDGARIESALRSLGYEVERNANAIFAAKEKTRSVYEIMGDGTYAITRGYTTGLDEVPRKYAEIGVRDWAKARGFGVASFRENRMVLVNRRG